MNWYKTSIEKQEDFPFFKDIPKQKQTPVEQTEQYLKLESQTPEIIQDLLDNCKDIKEAIKVLKTYKIKHKIIKDIVVIYLNNKIYIIDDMLTMKDAQEWLWSLSDWDLDDYITLGDSNKDFWDYPSVVYHATTPEKWEIIKEKGLERRDRSRGIDNRNTGSAIFTSDNPDDIGVYGNVVIEINAPQMKIDGYMPPVSKEKPIEEAEKREALANLIGLDDFYVEVESGIRTTTIVFFGHIPSKYLRKI